MIKKQDKSYMIPNWEDFQHYKGRNKNYSDEMPWLKIHGRQLIADLSFMQLHDGVRDTLTLCWYIASQRDGVLPNNKEIAFLIRKSQAEVDEHISFLLNDEWLIKYDEEKYKARYDNNDKKKEVSPIKEILDNPERYRTGSSY